MSSFRLHLIFATVVALNLFQTSASFGRMPKSPAKAKLAEISVAADYDGDGRTDVAVFRPSNATWYIVQSTAGILIQQFGQTGDVPTQSSYLY